MNQFEKKYSSEQYQEDAYLRSQKRLKEIKEFYYSLILYFLVIPFLIFINYQTSWDFHWFWFPMFGWGLGLIIGAFKVFVNNGPFGRNWEKRKIEDFMRKEEQTNLWN